MKCIGWIVALLISAQAMAQKTETYYDWNWKPCESLNARFYSTLEKTDSGWLRSDYFLSGLKMQMKALYADSACKVYNGTSVFFHANGQVSRIGRQIYNKREGVCLGFYSNGMMSDSATYHNNVPVGNDYRWWPNGVLKDSVAHVNDSMDVSVSWFDNGTPAEAGYLLHGKMHGKWQFFHKTGQLAALESYDHGKVLSKQFFKEDGTPQPDTSKDGRSAVFKGRADAWQNWLYSRLYWPPGYKFSNGDMAVTVVDMVIDEDGKMESVEVTTPFHPVFDKLALDIIGKSPNWTPAVRHNRRVKSYFRQPVTFREE